ncbi:MAG: bifunctional homocysteine S-methyltransferase/methylenetetrahydrofolate reductase [Planctomycetota bacterium]|nr:bifunctional homocysteine S-methyltransferase/methylenetetrahydrofolate reductase [Planctomycetota bacterium]
MLGDRPLIGDGAMGTLLYEQGLPLDRSFEALNLERPELIESIHRSYVEAGVDLIETNTFGANAERLLRSGQDHLVRDINAAGVKVAQRACVGRDVFIAGSIGPLSRSATAHGGLEPTAQHEIFVEQAVTLADAGVDLILLETFTSFAALRTAFEAVKEVCDLPVVAQMAFVERTGSFQGDEPVPSLTEVWRLGADVVGINCGRGPRLLLDIIERFALRTGHPLSAFFNAGSPDLVDGRFLYLKSAPYLADTAERLCKAGVNLIGGCCGTTPEVIAAIAERLKDSKLTVRPQVPIPAPPRVKVGSDPVFPPSFLDGPPTEPSVIAELDPPRGMDFEGTLEGAVRMRKAGVDLVSLAENPLASPRMGNVAMALLMKQQAGVEPLVHFTCRDRNLIGLHSDIMGACALGLHYILAITGDPVSVIGEFGAKGVYDVTSFGLVKLIAGLNRGVNAAGASIKVPTSLRIGVAFGSNVKHLHVQVERLERKKSLGAHFTLTQPCWDPERIAEVFEQTRDLDMPLYLGIMPFASERNAEFLHNEVPGMSVPDGVRRRMKGLRGPEGREMGCRICEELLDVVAEHSSRVYLITPFNHYGTTARLTEYFKERVRARARQQQGA